MDDNTLALHRIAYVNSQIACAMIELEAMKAQNIIDSKIDDRSVTYQPYDFEKLMDKYGLYHNAVLTALNGH